MKAAVVPFLALVALTAGLGAPAAADVCERFPGIAYVAARGEVEVERVPDRAVLQVSVTQRGKTNADVLSALAAKADKLVAALRGSGIPDNRISAPGPTAKDIFDIVRDENGNEVVEKRTKVGIEATYAATVEVGGVDTPEGRKVLEKTIAAIGGTDGMLTSIRFSLAGERDLVAQLERDATKAAVAKAKGLIEAAGGRAGRVLAISDAQHQTPEPFHADLARAAPATPAAQVSFAILPGTQRFVGTVEVVLESLP